MSGTPVSREATATEIARALQGGLGEENVQRRAFGIGKSEPGNDVGKHKAVWAKAKLAGPGNPIVVDVAHNLGEIPVLCELVEYENPGTPATIIVANAADKAKWTESNVRMRVWLLNGSLDACLAKFIVRGA